MSRPGASPLNIRASSGAGPGLSDDATATLLVVAASEAATPAAPHDPSTCDHAAATASHGSLGGHSDAGGCGL